MKKQVFFVHGGNAFSKYADFLSFLQTTTIHNLPMSGKMGFWSNALAEDLGDDYEVFAPTMPNKQNAQYSEWKIWFERHFQYLSDEVVLVGWSLGGMFLAKYLIENNLPFNIKALYLLAAPCGTCSSGGGSDCGSFQFFPEKLPEIAKKSGKISIWHSEDDLVVPYEHALNYKKHLPDAEITTFTDKNHFLIANFSELIKNIKEL